MDFPRRRPSVSRKPGGISSVRIEGGGDHEDPAGHHRGHRRLPGRRLARTLTKRGHVVRCCLTDAGSRFITPLTLASLTGQPCFGANPDYHEWRPNPIIEHVDLARWADVVAVVPATADIMGKTANGLANDLLSTLLLATTRPGPLGPGHEQGHVGAPGGPGQRGPLKSFGHTLVEPVEGHAGLRRGGRRQAGGDGGHRRRRRGPGRPGPPGLLGRADPDHRRAHPGGPGSGAHPHQPLLRRHGRGAGPGLPQRRRPGGPGAGRRPGRALGGGPRSGCAAPRTCWRPAWPSGRRMDGLVAAAAVADQRPEACAPEKVKKGEGPETLVLVRTPDVLATLSAGTRGPASGCWASPPKARPTCPTPPSSCT